MKIFLSLILAVFASIIALSAAAHAGQETATGAAKIETWRKYYGGESEESAYSIINASDGGYIFAGETHTYGRGRADAWVVKIDEHGTQLWDKTFGTIDEDFATKIIPSSKGGYILLTFYHLESRDALLSRVYLLNSKCSKVWEENYSIDTRTVKDVAPTVNGGVYVAGVEIPTRPTKGGTSPNIVTRYKTDKIVDYFSKESITWFESVDANGVNSQKKFFEVDKNPSHPPYIANVLDNGSAIVFHDYNGKTKAGKAFNVVAPDGTLITQKVHKDPPITCESKVVKKTPDGGYLIAGANGVDSSILFHGLERTYELPRKEYQACAIKFDSTGEIVWGKTYDGKHGSSFSDVAPLPDGTFAFAGKYKSSRKDDPAIWLVRVDANGNLLKEKLYSDGKHILARSIAATPDGGVIVAGSMHVTEETKHPDALIMKLDLDFEYAKQ